MYIINIFPVKFNLLPKFIPEYIMFVLGGGVIKKLAKNHTVAKHKKKFKSQILKNGKITFLIKICDHKINIFYIFANRQPSWKFQKKQKIYDKIGSTPTIYVISCLLIYSK